MKNEKKHNVIYIILNEVNGKTYIGAHSTDDLDDGYMGSGTALKRAQKKYGIEKFKRSILYDFDNLIEMYKKESEIVNEDFIKSKFNYNIKLGGNEGWNCNNTISVKDTNGNCYRVYKDDPKYLSGGLVGVTTGFVCVKDKSDNLLYIEKNDSRYLSGELVHCNTDFVTLKDKDGFFHKVSTDDPRYLSGELVGTNTGMISVKDINENYFSVVEDDSRYLSGELVGITKGKMLTKEHKAKIGKANSVKQKGKFNSQYGTCWVYNLLLKESKKISKNELDSYLDNGWLKGRRLKF